MAERRMLSRTILDSDKFLDLPLTTQVLYIHLIMNADDDGFLNNSQKIIRMIGASKKDFELLIISDFIIDFENGICAVRHWKLHNYIRSDRYRSTVHQNELKKLTVAENKVYELFDYSDDEIDDFLEEKIDGIPSENQMEPQDRLDKNRLDKNSRDKDIIKEKQLDNEDTLEHKNIEESNEDYKHKNSVNNPIDLLINNEEINSETINNETVNNEFETLDNLEENNYYVNKIIEKWNMLGISNISCIKNTRRKLLKARIKEYGKEDVIKAIEKIEKSSFLKGQNDRSWVITFDWFVKPNNFTKVFEGNYDDKNNSNKESLIKSNSKKLSFNNFPQREYDYDDLEKKLLGWN